MLVVYGKSIVPWWYYTGHSYLQVETNTGLASDAFKEDFTVSFALLLPREYIDDELWR